MDNFRNILTSIVLCFILILAVTGKPDTTEAPASYGGDASVYVGGQPYYLSGTGLTSSATSIGLTDFSVYKNDGTKHELTTANVAGDSGVVHMTIEPGNSTKQEFVSCTTVTQGSGTSATLSGCSRGLLPFSPYTASSTYAFPHNGGAKVVITNGPGFYNQFAAKANDESISGTWTFADSPLLTTDCTVASADSEICAKAYIDSVGLAGAADANLTTKGLVEIATQSEAASSSTYGATSAYLAIPANMATDTPNTATRASRVVMSDLTGYLKQGWLNLTEAFTWAGEHIFNGKTTHNGGLLSTASSTFSNATTTFAGGVAGITNYQTFTSTGTWTKPSGLSDNAIVFIEAWGGGGGSGSCYHASQSPRAGGGGGGSYASRYMNASILTSTVAVTIGDGGTGGAATGNNDGGVGGNTTFGAFLTAYGGGGGGSGTEDAISGVGGGGGGLAGAGTNGTQGSGEVAGGGPGASTLLSSDGYAGGYGGGAQAGGASAFGGGGGGGGANTGGASVWGGGGGGGGTSVYGGAGGANGADGQQGTVGSVPGGGAGACDKASTNLAGVAGGKGLLRITVIK